MERAEREPRSCGSRPLGPLQRLRREETGQALVEQSLLIAAVLGLFLLPSFPFTKELLGGLAAHLDWVRFVVEAPFP